MGRFTLATAALLAGTLLTGTVLAGCTGSDDETDPGEPGSDGSVPVETTSEIGQIAGKLGKGKQDTVLGEVTAVVDGWLDAAFVEGDYPRADFADAFPGFTAGAAEQAAGINSMSNAGVGEQVDGIEVEERSVKVDVLAPGGDPSGATARVKLVIGLSGDVERTDRIRGRLMLTPSGGGWEVFGFDVRRKEGVQ